MCMAMEVSKYFCNHCVNPKTSKYFSTSAPSKWERHISSEQHEENTLKFDDVRNSKDNLQYKYCKVCDTWMDKEAFKEHCNRNMKMLKMKYNMGLDIFQQCICDNFIYNNKRFASYEDLRTYAIQNPQYNMVETLYDNFYESLPVEIKNSDPWTVNEAEIEEKNDDFDAGLNAYFSYNLPNYGEEIILDTENVLAIEDEYDSEDDSEDEDIQVTNKVI